MRRPSLSTAAPRHLASKRSVSARCSGCFQLQGGRNPYDVFGEGELLVEAGQREDAAHPVGLRRQEPGQQCQTARVDELELPEGDGAQI